MVAHMALRLAHMSRMTAKPLRFALPRGECHGFMRYNAGRKPATETTTTNAPQNAKKNTKPSLRRDRQEKVLDAEMEWAKVELLLDTLEAQEATASTSTRSRCG